MVHRIFLDSGPVSQISQTFLPPSVHFHLLLPEARGVGARGDGVGLGGKADPQDYPHKGNMLETAPGLQVETGMTQAWCVSG